MAEIMLRLPGYRCERCGHEWAARTPRNVKVKKGAELPKPKQCPHCKSAWWETPPSK